MTALANGNYVVDSPEWNGGRGAVTWGDGTVGSRGVVTAGNSLVGTQTSDQVGGGGGLDLYGNPEIVGGVTVLKNGNFVVLSPFWDGLEGAATWGSGTGGNVGPVSAANSVVDFPHIDLQYGYVTVAELPNGDSYVLSVPGHYDASATWMSGADGSTLDGGRTVTTRNGFVGGGAIGVTPMGDDQKALVQINNYPQLLNPVGFTDPNALTFDWGQGQTVPMIPEVITRALSAGIDVTLEANNDLVINSPLVVSTTGAPGHLTLKAGRSILLNADIDTGGGSLTLVGNAALADGVVDGLRDPGVAEIKGAPGVTVDTRGGGLVVDLEDGVDKTNHDRGGVTLKVVHRAALSLAPSANPSGDGQDVTYIFQAAPLIAGDPIPAGSVVFSVDGVPSAPAPLSAGAATYTIALPAGSHAIAATYTSTNDYEPATVTLTQDVAPVVAAVVGPAGIGTPRYVGASQPLSYRINFGNGVTATDPVKELLVVHELDLGLDSSTLELTGFGWGNIDVTVPAGLQSYSTRISTTNLDSSPLYVDVSIGLDRGSGVVSWSFRSVDPATGEVPDAPQAGFLPPDDGTGRGEGYVQYTVRPEAGLTTGTAIKAQAVVVFDSIVALNTNTASNTIDAGLPTSRVNNLPDVSPTLSFPVTWSGFDQPNESGMGEFNVYISDNGSPWTLWQAATPNLSATFTGQEYHRYTFYSQAIDNVGNLEPFVPIPQAGEIATTGDYALADVYGADAGKKLSVSAGRGLLANDLKKKGFAYTATVVDEPAHGVLALKANGSFTYVPDGTFAGNDSFTYRVHDNTGHPGNITTVTLATQLVTLRVQKLRVSESAAKAVLWVDLRKPAAAVTTVDYTAEAITATAGADFKLPASTITFQPGERHKAIPLGIVNDTVDEFDETFRVLLSNPATAVLARHPAAMVTIRDNDASPKVRFTAKTSSVSEGAGAVTLEVTLSAPSEKPVTVNFAAIGGTATAGADYTLLAGTLTFQPGETVHTITMTIIDDTVKEPTETVRIKLSAPTNARLRTALQTLSIVDDD